MTTTVYTTPSCGQCTLTKNWLTAHGIPFDPVDLTESPEAMATVKALGYHSAPVIVTPDAHWYGFRPDLLANIKAAVTK